VKINGKALAVAFALTLAGWAVVWAITIDQIWQNVYDSTNTSLRITQVSP